MDMDPILIDDDDDDDAVIIEDEDDAGHNKTFNNTVIPCVTVKDSSLLTAPPLTTDNNNEGVIVIDDKEKYQPIISESCFKVSLQNNRLLDKIVTHCMKCIGMPRVINKTLLPLYMDADVSYKQSESFRDLLKRTYKLLIRDPDHKFLHIKTLCEGLKSGLRKKVPFVTLATNLNQEDHYETTRNNSVTTFPHIPAVSKVTNNKKPNGDTGIKRKRGRPRKGPVGEPRSKRRKIQSPQKKGNNFTRATKTRKGINSCKNNKIEDVISLDSSDESGVDHNEVNTETAQEIVGQNNLHEQNNECEIPVQVEENSNSTESNKSNKENNLNIDNNGCGDMHDNNEINKGNELRDDITSDFEHLIPNKNEINKDNELRDEITTDFEHLIPKSQIEITFQEPECAPNLRIEHLEREMEFYQKKIEMMETCVVNSNLGSPYVQCDKYKRKVLECYKKICELMEADDNLVKRREIRLNVAEGHPPGPAKILERYLNQNIDEKTGNVLLPDFVDVMDCVLVANREDNLGWSNERALQEASMLFTECATMLRKSRQKREYRDLLGFVKEKELVDDDPADKDPELLAKLEKNKQIAKAREDEVLDRYVNMQNSKAILHSGLVSMNDDEASDDDDESYLPTSSSNTASNISETTEASRESSNNNEPIVNFADGSNSKAPDGNDFAHPPTLDKTEELVRNDSINTSNANCDIIGVEKQIKNEITGLDDSCKLSVDNVPSLSSDMEHVTNSGLVSNESLSSVNNGSSVTNDNSGVNPSGEVVKVKTEPIDVQSMFDQLGDNFVCSIFGIEEQFVVIEISDSSSEDES